MNSLLLSPSRFLRSTSSRRREIVIELDKYIVGQNAAKKAVAIALRNRVRRNKLQPELAEDILPKNILMIGPPVWAKRRSRGGSRGWRDVPS